MIVSWEWKMEIILTVNLNKSEVIKDPCILQCLLFNFVISV